MGLVGPLLDNPHIWCIVIRLFMRPLTSPAPRASRRNYRAGEVAGVIGRIILHSLITIILTVIIGLGVMILLDIIRPEQIPNIFKFIGQYLGGRDIKIIGPGYYQNYYPGPEMGLYNIGGSQLDIM